jgi:hypothetical protein
MKKIKENKSIIIKCYNDDFKNNSVIDSSVGTVALCNQFTTALIDNSITQ